MPRVDSTLIVVMALQSQNLFTCSWGDRFSARACSVGSKPWPSRKECGEPWLQSCCNGFTTLCFCFGGHDLFLIRLTLFRCDRQGAVAPAARKMAEDVIFSGCLISPWKFSGFTSFPRHWNHGVSTAPRRKRRDLALANREKVSQVPYGSLERRGRLPGDWWPFIFFLGYHWCLNWTQTCGLKQQECYQ